MDRPTRIRVLFVVKKAIQKGANRIMEDLLGHAGANTFSVPMTKDGETWYAACVCVPKTMLVPLKAKIKNQIDLGNALVWAKEGRVKLVEEQYTKVSASVDSVG